MTKYEVQEAVLQELRDPRRESVRLFDVSFVELEVHLEGLVRDAGETAQVELFRRVAHVKTHRTRPLPADGRARTDGRARGAGRLARTSVESRSNRCRSQYKVHH